MTLLDERELTAAERQAIADEPRPGVWIDTVVTVKVDGPPIEVRPNVSDGRTLTQDETDTMIARELFRERSTSDQETKRLVSTWLTRGIYFNGVEPTQQRGGIHSDPLVRLLAYRAWGERDRQWFTLLFADAHEIVALRPGGRTPAPQHAGHYISVVENRGGATVIDWEIEIRCSCGTRFRIPIEARDIARASR